MQNYQGERSELPRGLVTKESAWVVLRALRSTLVIGAVAVTVSVVRSGGFRWDMITRLAVSYRTVLTMIFLGLLVWEYWAQRVRRRRANVAGGAID